MLLGQLPDLVVLLLGHLLQLALSLLALRLHLVVLDHVLRRTRQEILRHHLRLLHTLVEARLDGEELALELLYVLLAVLLHLLHDLLLRVHVSLQVLLLRQRLVQLVLQPRVLLGQHLIRLLSRLQLYLHVLSCQSLVLELGLGVEEVGVGLRVLFLLLLVPLDPHLAGLLLGLQYIV